MPKVKSPGYLVGTTGNLYLSEGGVRAWVYALDRANAEIERHERVQAKLVKMFLDYSNHADAEMRDNGLTLNPDGTVTEIGHG